MMIAIQGLLIISSLLNIYWAAKEIRQLKRMKELDDEIWRMMRRLHGIEDLKPNLTLLKHDSKERK